MPLDVCPFHFVKQIKNQGSCKSSWAFSATGALEGQLYKASRQLVALSEQQLLDCSEAFGNNGCYGGVTSNAFTYVSKCGGVCRESNYPYLGYVSHSKCQCQINLYCLYPGKWLCCQLLLKAFLMHWRIRQDPVS